MKQRMSWWLGLVGLSALLLSGDAPVSAQDRVRVMPESWQRILQHRLRMFGHRNWIVIADSAYPSQSRPGIETVFADGIEQLDLTRKTLDAISELKHVRPVICLDAELPHVSNDDAPGIDAYREQLNRMLAGKKPQSLPHEQIIEKLEKTGDKFHVLVLKTNLRLPYTSVFLELDCGYWTPEAEKRLREAMGGTDKKP